MKKSINFKLRSIILFFRYHPYGTYAVDKRFHLLSRGKKVIGKSIYGGRVTGTPVS